MTRIRGKKKPHINGKKGKNNQPNFRCCFEHLSRIFPNQLCMVILIGSMDRNDLLSIISMLESLCPTVASTALFPIKKVINSCKKAIYNLPFSPLDIMQHFKVPFVANFIERKIKDSQTIEKRCNDRNRLASGSMLGERRNTSPEFRFGKEWGRFNVPLVFQIGKVVPKPFPAFEMPSNCRDTEYQVVEPCIVVQIIKHAFELIADSEKLAQTSEITHYKIATLILSGWNNGCIPRVGVTLKYFLAFFIQSLGIYVNACIKETKPNSQGDPKSDEEGTEKPIDKQQARAGVPAMTKAGLKEHMASLRQMWCQEFSAGLAEDLLSQEQQQALRRFGKERGLKQYEIDNILNASSASLKEKGHALMDDWQHGRGGSIVRRGKQLQQEHFEETLKALSRRDRNPRKDKESKPPFPPDSDC